MLGLLNFVLYFTKGGKLTGIVDDANRCKSNPSESICILVSPFVTNGDVDTAGFRWRDYP